MILHPAPGPLELARAVLGEARDMLWRLFLRLTAPRERGSKP